MTDYVLTHDGDVSAEAPGPLPVNWRNISGLNALSRAELTKLGWLPTAVDVPEFDPDTETCRQTGWDVQASKVVPVWEVKAKPLDQIKSEAKARVAAKRWEAEVGGIEVMGAAIDTSRESQAMLAGANLLAATYPDQIIDWKTDGGWA
jgi:hypothetical protein